ncbi:MAG TPA: YHS domain-containing (seleno)protein [Limnobacter sp.]|nr:YHS domain-containing (seleno)protein [Limnobacter sp.]
MTLIASTRRLALVAATALALTGCSAMTAQNPSAGLSPVNAIAMDQSDRVMLFGADVVAYFTQKQYVQGKSDIRSTYKDVDFYFSSPEHKAQFDAEPEKYLPQYGGYCANGIMFGIPWGGNAQDFSVVDGKLYIFGGEVSKAAFELNLQESIRLADTYWQQEVANNNSFIQRTKRLVVRVPHYKSGEEQAAEVQAAKSGG